MYIPISAMSSSVKYLYLCSISTLLLIFVQQSMIFLLLFQMQECGGSHRTAHSKNSVCPTVLVSRTSGYMNWQNQGRHYDTFLQLSVHRSGFFLTRLPKILNGPLESRAHGVDGSTVVMCCHIRRGLTVSLGICLIGVTQGRFQNCSFKRNWYRPYVLRHWGGFGEEKIAYQPTSLPKGLLKIST